jgi:hypothetical protein
MSNFRVDSISPWLRFVSSGDPLRLREPSNGPQSSGFDLTSFGYGAMPADGGDAIGLSNWRPPNSPKQSAPEPWYLVPQRIGADEFKFDPNSPWLHVGPPDGPPGFRVAPDGTATSGQAGNGPAGWSVPSVGPAPSFVSGLFAQQAPPLTEPPARLPGPGEELYGRPGARWPWLRAESMGEPTGFQVGPDGPVTTGRAGNSTASTLGGPASNVGPAAPFAGGLFAQQAPPLTEAPVETQPWWSRSPARGEGPDGLSDPRWPWLRAEPMHEPPRFRVGPYGPIDTDDTSNGTVLGLDWHAANVDPSAPFAGGLVPQQGLSPTEPAAEAQPWWARPPGQSAELDGRPDLRWPWLRAEPIAEQPGLRVNPDGSEDQSKPDDFNPMSFAYQPFGQMTAEDIGADTQPQVGARNRR